MTLPPIPPSDNLYKFTAIGGLILAVLSLYVPQQLLTQHKLSTIEVNAELAKLIQDGHLLDFEKEQFEPTTKSLFADADEFLKRLKDLNKENSPDLSKGELAKVHGMGKWFMEQMETSVKEMKSRIERGRENRHLLEKVYSEIQKLTYLEPQLNKLLWTSVITFFVGVIMMVFGFWNWYFKFQIYQDQIVKAQAAQWTTPKPEAPDRDEIPG